MKKPLYTHIIGKKDKFINRILSSTTDAWRKQKVPLLFEGILRSEGVLVTEIARQVQSDPDKLHGELKSLTNHLKSVKWDEDELKAQQEYIRYIAGEKKDRLVILTDTSDIAKKYAEKMENLGRIRDASLSMDFPVIANGYHTFETYVRLGDTVAPLLNFPFSLEDANTASMNHAIRVGYRTLREALPDTPTLFVEDRGFDSAENYAICGEFGHDFLVRQRGDRILYTANGSRMGSTLAVAERMELDHTARFFVKKDDERKSRKRLFDYDFKTVFLDNSGKKPYSLIVVRRGAWIMCLLTSIPVTNQYECEGLIRFYVLRWKVEESIRFVKSTINIESVRVLSFRAVKRLLMFAYWAMGFLGVLQLELPGRVLNELIRLGKPRKFKVEFLFYRIIKGLKVLLGYEMNAIGGLIA